MRKSILLICIFLSSFIYSQEYIPPASIDPTGLTYGGSSANHGFDFDTVLGEMINNHKEKKDFDIDKEPFLFKNWFSNLKVVTNKGKVYKLKSSNYHIDNDYIVSRISKDSIFIWDDVGVDYFLLNNIKLKKFDIGHLQVLTEGDKESLYKKYYTKTIQRTIEDNPLAIPSKEKYTVKVKSIYYLIDKNGKKKKVKLKKKSLLNSLNLTLKEKIKKYAKKNKLSFKKEKDVIKILNYYNTL